MKKLLTTACLSVVTTVAIVSFTAPTVFGQEQKTAKVNPSPPKSSAQEVLDPERKALYEKWMRFPTLVKNWVTNAKWAASGKRLWYWTGIPDRPELQVLDLESNKIRAFLDATKVRAALASKLGHEPAGAGLPFQNFEFTDATETRIRFSVEGREFELHPETHALNEWPPVPEATRRITQPQRTRHADVPGWPVDLVEIRSPDGRSFAHLKDHNVWIRSAEDGRLVQLTRDGVADYEWAADEADEEGRRWAWWSPDGKRLAVRKEDNRQVLKMPILDYDSAGSVHWARMAPLGGKRPQPELWVLDPSTLKHTRIDIGPEPDQMLQMMGWRTDGSELLYVRTNRLWTKWELLAADPVTGASRIVLSDSQDYLRGDIAQGLRFLSDGERFIRLSDQDGWAHLSLYDMRGNLLRRLTKGNWEVLQIVAIAEASGWVYFRGRDDPARPYDTHFYRVRLDGSGFKRLTDEPGRHGGFVSPSGEFFIDQHSDLARPWRFDLRRGDGTHVRTLAVADTSGLGELGWSAPEAFVVKADDGVTDLHGVLWKPANLDPSRKYPVIEHIYGGGASVVPGVFTLSGPGVWAQAMAQLGFITLMVDGRGVTQGRGRQFAAWTFGNMGRYEIPDHVAALRQLAAKRPYMDLKRVGIYGYSWGGHFAMRALLQAPDAYHVGVAGAPDTDLRWFTYQGDGYPQYRGGLDYASNLWLADRLQGKLLIYHGTSDLNVPINVTMKMINEFIRHGKRVDLMLFPGKTHAEVSEPTLYQGYVLPMARDYFVEHLKPLVAPPRARPAVRSGEAMNDAASSPMY